MSLNLFHQVGHNPNWNIESLENDDCGSGLILSPVHQSKIKIEELDEDIKKRSFFDPQFYLPNSKKSKFSTYPFFPETIAGGFSISDYLGVADEAAKQCVAFQIEQGFRAITIPARFFDQMYPDYTDKQDALTVKPFIKAIKKYKKRPQVFLTLPVTSHMVEHPAYRTQLLNWVTSFPEIDGVYVIVSNDRNTKQIQDSSYLENLLMFLNEIQQADLTLLVGYLNTESLLLSLLDDANLSFGTFENTRIFSLDKFILKDEDTRGPRPRIYLTGLLNWVRFDQAKVIKEEAPSLWKKIYTPTSHAEKVFSAALEPHFSQPALYKHHLLCLSEQFKNLAAEKSFEGRFNKLDGWLKDAKKNYKEIGKLPIELDVHGGDGHIEAWSKAINAFGGL